MLWGLAHMLVWFGFKAIDPTLMELERAVRVLTLGLPGFLAAWAGASAGRAELSARSPAGRYGLVLALFVAAAAVWFGLARTLVIWVNEGERPGLITLTDVALMSGIVLGLVWGMGVRFRGKIPTAGGNDPG
jgi:hypothetical protein